MSDVKEPEVVPARRKRPDGREIFCKDCAYFYWSIEEFADTILCKAHHTEDHDYRHRWIVYGDPREINKYNNCHRFKESRWFRFCKAIRQYKTNVKNWLRHPLINFIGGDL